MATGMLTSSNNTPIKLYHGCSQPMTANSDIKHLYVTPSPSYSYIKDSEYVYELEANVFAPFYTENQSFIESLRSFPQKMKMLTDLGFDAVIYSSRKNITKGASGWGNDHAQYLLLSAEKSIINIRQVPDRSRLTMTHIDDSVLTGELYHSTSNHFTQFKHEKSGDIGFHFGTELAAKQRAKSIGANIECTVSKITASSNDVFAKRIDDGTLPSFTHMPVLELLFKKLNHVKGNLIRQVEDMSLGELADVSEIYATSPPSANFQKMLFRAHNHGKYLIEVEGKKDIIVDSEVEAKAYQQAIKGMALKRGYLALTNVLHINDLGTWAPENILREITTTEEQNNAFYAIDGDSERFSFLRGVITELGYDGLSYTNAVEDAGSTSYIAFSPKSIRIEPGRLPEIPEIPGNHLEKESQNMKAAISPKM